MISSSSNFFPSYFIEYQVKSKLVPFLAYGETSGNAKVVLLLEFGETAVQSLNAWGK
jgi:hypothetical protein